MKIKFRFHGVHGGLFSMDDVIEVEKLSDIERLIRDKYDPAIAISGGIKRITYEYRGIDNRNDWHTYYVVVHLYPSSENGYKDIPEQFVAGYSNGVPID